MISRPLVLIVPSLAAALELPRRLAATGRAVAGIYALKPLELARRLAEPLLLGRGLAPWTRGHDALLAARLLAQQQDDVLRLPDETPRAPVAAALARTLGALRRSGVNPEQVAALGRAAGDTRDGRRLAALSRLLQGFQKALADTSADPLTLLAAAREELPRAPLLAGAEILLVDDLELEPGELDLLGALAAAHPLRVLRRPLPPSLRPGSSRAALLARGVSEVDWAGTPLAAIAPAGPPASLLRLRQSLFEPPAGGAVEDGGVELLTAAGEAAEARAVVRRLLRAAASGVPFEEMGIVLPRPETYAPLFTDLLARLGIPHRLHPSLPLRFGRSARSLLLLFRCRGLERSVVLEFLTFAPVPFEALLGPDCAARPSQWDEISREAGIVSGLSRWIVGLRAWAEAEREAAATETEGERREQRLSRAAAADSLLHVVEILAASLDTLSGEAAWPEWVERLRTACDQWLGPERDREVLLDLVADLGTLGSVSSHARWEEVEQVLESRLEWERLPAGPPESGAVHVGALDAMAGLPFRVLAITGLVEGGYPGVIRQDPFLLDAERAALAAPAPDGEPPAPAVEGPQRGANAGRRRSSAKEGRGEQLELFGEAPAGEGETLRETLRSGLVTKAAPAVPGVLPPTALPTSQDRLREARRLFHRAVSQAGERLILSYPRADARSGRERLPSLFFAAAASTLAGRALAGLELERMVFEDDPASLALEDALDACERDRTRLLREPGAATAVAAGSVFFRQSRLASQARWSNRLTRYDGLMTDGGGGLRERLDPLATGRAVSASRLATYARCGFQYLLQYVLHLRPAPEPEERRRIEPLERGNLFHQVAERFLRERRQQGELPLSDSEPLRERLRVVAEEALEGLVATSPPRFTLLWEREKRRFHTLLQEWLTRELAAGRRSVPAHFELSFGLGRERDPEEPHDPAPVEIDLGEGQTLRICGQIDRIDRRTEGGLVLRDYKTGRAPRDDGGLFRGGRQLQIPFYVLAAARLLPGEAVVDAFLDYVDGGRQVAFRPELAAGEGFRRLLRSLLSLIAQGAFVQDPLACDFCDFTAVCGPKALLQRRREMKRRDPLLQEYLRLRDVG